MKKLLFSAVFFLVCSASILFAQERTPVQLPGTIRSTWQKPNRYTVTAPNIVAVRGTGEDADEIVLRDIPYNGAKNLVVVVRAMSGKFPWGGKMFGVKANGKQLVPNDKVVSDHFIEGPMTVGEALVHPLDGITGNTITLNVRTFVGAQYTLEFWYE